MSEQEWVWRARAGDEGAFTQLVEAYQTPIYNLCYRMLGEAGEAEDAAQETFLRTYSQLSSSYDPARAFKTWLFSIANHHCIDRLRKRRLIWLSIDDDNLPPHPALQEQAPGPEEALVRRQQAELLQGLLAKLPPEDRSVIVMRYWYDFSYEEIAEATHATVSSVKSRLHRARGSMSQMLAPGAAAPRPAARNPVRVGG